MTYGELYDLYKTAKKEELKEPAAKAETKETKPQTPPVVSKLTELFGKDAPNVTIKND